MGWNGIDAPFIDATYVGDSKGNRIRPGQEKAIPLDNTNKVQLVGITNTEFQVTAYVNTLEDPQIDSQNPPEAIPPTVTLVSPSDGSTGVESNTNIVVTFSELVDPDTINSSTFTISPSLTLVRTINTITGVSVVTATHATRFTASTTYTVTLTTAITDFLGNPMTANYVFSFTTQAAPSVTTQFPANAPTNVAVDTLIYGIYSENILAGSVTATTFTISPSVTVVRYIDSLDPKKVVMDPSSNLANSTAYTITLTTGVTDSAGTPAVLSTWSFTTAAAGPPPDTTPPTIVSKTPAASATQQLIGVSPMFVFSESMNAAFNQYHYC